MAFRKIQVSWNLGQLYAKPMGIAASKFCIVSFVDAQQRWQHNKILHNAMWSLQRLWMPSGFHLFFSSGQPALAMVHVALAIAAIGTSKIRAGWSFKERSGVH